MYFSFVCDNFIVDIFMLGSHMIAACLPLRAGVQEIIEIECIIGNVVPVVDARRLVSSPIIIQQIPLNTFGVFHGC